MIKTNLITLVLLFLITLTLFTRLAIKKFLLKENIKVIEWLFSFLHLLLTIANLDLYLLVTNFYRTVPYTYTLSYSYLLSGPVIYGVVNEIKLKKLLKIRAIIITITLYFVLSTVTLYLLYSGKVNPSFGKYPYLFMNLSTLFFIVWSIIHLLRWLPRDKMYVIKMFICISAIIPTTLFSIGLDFFASISILLNCFIVIILNSSLPLLIKKKKYSYSNQTSSEYDLILKRFMKIINEERIFLDHSCRLDMVADEIGARRDQLSQVINTHYKKRFNDVINEFRINYAISLLNNPITITDIIMESGFSSKSSFYAYFKKVTGLTPIEYKKSSEL